ncbi:MAG TPA: amylo-alpha-1,6-glucosidase, partial [Planctomycetota bacterium]|nr:amylo-alpha-1,6-glucosidase [Planctomycetota bacterium]
LSTGRAELAYEMLAAWAARLRDGLLPNRLGDVHEVDDNSADAPLLFVRAVELLDKALKDRRRIERRFYPAVNAVLDAYHEGTRHGIGVDVDGLLRAGEPGQALTWMDAVVNGEAVTPRRGKPIELNALYGEALRFGAELADRCDDVELGALYRERAMILAAAMRDRFLHPETGYLRDVVDPAGPGDPDAFRPNLLFALAAKSSPFSREEAERNLARVAVDLLTPMGLRTLAPGHPRYVARYEGDQLARDRAYHQGTVWPWLIGVYADAILNVRGRVPSARQAVEAALTPLLKFAADFGHLPEVFDGDRPHHPGGCPAQAWSTAEVLRALDLVTE